MSSTGLSNYRQIKKLGQGSFGSVFLVEHRDRKQYVMKTIDLNTLDSKGRKVCHLYFFCQKKLKLSFCMWPCFCIVLFLIILYVYNCMLIYDI